MKFIRYLVRHNELVTYIIQDKVFGKRGRGRQNKSYLEDINRMQIGKYCYIKGAALDRWEWLRLQDIAF